MTNKIKGILLTVGVAIGWVMLELIIKKVNSGGYNGLEHDWLNDGVKGFLSKNNDIELNTEMSNLKIFVAKPEYLLAMKCMASRKNKDSIDIEDAKFLINKLNLHTVDDVMSVVGKYYPESLVTIKTQYFVEELFDNDVTKFSL